MPIDTVDVIIIGAGLSGIGAAVHLRKNSPNKTFMILEGRDAIGGTWDLFRYPGIRSDSDMFTLGYKFKPWTERQVIADGHLIRNYINETADENDVRRHIRFGKKVVSANWSSDDALWTLDIENKDGSSSKVRGNFLISCTGYYDYKAGYTPDFPGRENFTGTFIHPQHWPKDLDYSDKNVLIIGSGATAVTLLPAMSDKAKHVTMLQRSPSYVASIPQSDPISENLRKFLPEKIVYRMARARNVALQAGFYHLCKKQPGFARNLLLKMVKKQLGEHADMKHFTPDYNPWDERLCAVPSGDLFKVIRQGKASVVTDLIDTFTADGIKLKSGQELQADIIVSATGLTLQLLGGVKVSVDNKPIDVSQSMAYRALMLSDIPNAAMIFGYTNASWTLKADISSEYLCRLINHMDKQGFRQVTPRQNDRNITEAPFLDMQSGYIQRAKNIFPKQGNKAPWKTVQNYMFDLTQLRYTKIDDGILEFTNPPAVKVSAPVSPVVGAEKKAKPAAKKAAVKKPAVKKPAVKKSAAKQPAKKAATKKSAAKSTSTQA